MAMNTSYDVVHHFSFAPCSLCLCLCLCVASLPADVEFSGFVPTTSPLMDHSQNLLLGILPFVAKSFVKRTQPCVFVGCSPYRLVKRMIRKGSNDDKRTDYWHRLSSDFNHWLTGGITDKQKLSEEYRWHSALIKLYNTIRDLYNRSCAVGRRQRRDEA